MASYLRVKDKNNESLVCVGIFLITIIYYLISYEKISDYGEYENLIETEAASLSAVELEE
jgi:hypothetical protein